jgi:predicted metal-dependent peptidase
MGEMDPRAARKLGLAPDETAVARQALDKIAAARIWLTKERPLLGVLARALRATTSLSITGPIAIVVDDRLLVHPEHALRTPFPALVARIAHVVLHAALGGFVRRGHRPLARWNLAHDLAIDPLVRAAGLESDYEIDDALLAELPSELLGGPSSAQGGAMAAESIDAALERLDAARAIPRTDWIDLYLDAPEDVPPETEASPPEIVDPSLGVVGKGAVPLPGQGAGIADSVGDESEDDKQEGRDDLAPNDAGEGQERQKRRAAEVTWRMRLAEAIAEDRAAGEPTWGKLPQWAQEWMQATVEPPPSWTAVLQRAVAALSRTERSYLRPSRRSAAIGWSSDVRLAGRRVVPAGQLAAVLDTSGSIDEPTMRRALGSIAAAATAEGLDEVRLIQADAEITDDRVMSPTDMLRAPIAVIGRGGTRFTPALELLAWEANQCGERGGVVYLTDLEGEFPGDWVTRYLDVLWVTNGTGSAPFGKTVRMTRR